jgi:hypothetical protein
MRPEVGIGKNIQRHADNIDVTGVPESDYSTGQLS